MAGAGGLAAGQITRAELGRLGFRLIVGPTTPLMAAHKALRQCYAALAGGGADPLLGAEAGWEQAIVHQTIDLEAMLETERQTVEKRNLPSPSHGFAAGPSLSLPGLDPGIAGRARG